MERKLSLKQLLTEANKQLNKLVEKKHHSLPAKYP